MVSHLTRSTQTGSEQRAAMTATQVNEIREDLVERLRHAGIRMPHQWLTTSNSHLPISHNGSHGSPYMTPMEAVYEGGEALQQLLTLIADLERKAKP